MTFILKIHFIQSHRWIYFPALSKSKHYDSYSICISISHYDSLTGLTNSRFDKLKVLHI